MIENEWSHASNIEIVRQGLQNIMYALTFVLFWLTFDNSISFYFSIFVKRKGNEVEDWKGVVLFPICRDG